MGGVRGGIATARRDLFTAAEGPIRAILWRWMSARRLSGVIGAVAATVLVGCGIGSPGPLHPATAQSTPLITATQSPSPAQFSLPAGLLATGQNWADFLQVIQAGTSVSGTLTYYEYDPSGSSHVDQGTNTVSGFVQGAAVQLTIGSSTYTGSLETDGSLDLSVTQSDGSISVEHFTPANISDYNAAIAPLQTMVEQWNTAYWGTQAAKSCILTVPGSYDVRVFVGEGGAQICSAAVSLSYSLTTTYVSSDGVLCIGTEGGVIVAVTDDGGAIMGTPICADVNAGTFPSAAAPILESPLTGCVWWDGKCW